MRSFEDVASVGIWGYGSEGRAARDYFARRCPSASITVLVDGAMPTELAGDDSVRVLGGEQASAAISRGDFEVLIKSPGISLYRAEVAAAKANGCDVTSTTNLWFAEHPDARKIVVTGTKGKSTTVRLLHHLLTAAGCEAALAGNVGIPLLATAPGKDWTAIELSSYQTADLAYAPDIVVFTNLYPEHGPWHGGHPQYYQDKLRVAGLTPQPLALANAADPQLRALLGGDPAVRWVNAEDGFHVRNGALFFGADEVELTGNSLRGPHNLTNIALALSACEAAGIDCFRRQADLSGFAQLPHRLEEFVLANGVVCVNDSISTVPEATIAALQAYKDREIVLILGGEDRGQDIGKLYPVLSETRLKGVIGLPATGRKIAQDLADRHIGGPVVFAESLEVAVAEALLLAAAGDVVLLSPAAPSFTQFRNFEERGNEFKRFCRQAGDR